MGMNTKILRKLSRKVQLRIKETDGIKEYIVERKSSQTGEWEVIARSLRKERAIFKKHNVWFAELHLLNLTSRMLSRRKTGKIKFLGIQIN